MAPNPRNQLTRQRMLYSYGAKAMNERATQKLDNGKVFLKKHLPTLVMNELLKQGMPLAVAHKEAHNRVRAFAPVINKAHSELQLMWLVSSGRVPVNNTIKRVLQSYPTTLGFAWKKMARDLGMRRAARLLSSRAKAALASPYTVLGKRRLMREFNNVKKNNHA